MPPAVNGVCMNTANGGYAINSGISVAAGVHVAGRNSATTIPPVTAPIAPAITVAAVEAIAQDLDEQYDEGDDGEEYAPSSVELTLQSLERDFLTLQAAVLQSDAQQINDSIAHAQSSMLFLRREIEASEESGLLAYLAEKSGAAQQPVKPLTHRAVPPPDLTEPQRALQKSSARCGKSTPTPLRQRIFIKLRMLTLLWQE